MLIKGTVSNWLKYGEISWHPGQQTMVKLATDLTAIYRLTNEPSLGGFFFLLYDH